MKKLLAIIGVSLVACAGHGAILDPWFIGQGPEKLDNRSFEDSPLGVGTPAGWSTIGSPSVEVVNSYTFFGGATTLNPYSFRTDAVIPGDVGTYTFLGRDVGGDKFVKIGSTAGANIYEGISQQIDMLAGQTIYGWYAYDENVDGRLKVSAEDGGEVFVRIETSDVTGWKRWVFTPTYDSTYNITFQVQNRTAGQGGFALFDMTAIPEPRGWLMGGTMVGILGIGAWIRRRQQAKATA